MTSIDSSSEAFEDEPIDTEADAKAEKAIREYFEAEEAKYKLGSRHYLFLLIVTGIYLLFELAFNARLLDVVGTTLDKHAVEQIENFGRLISGLALTLVVWPKIMKKIVGRKDVPERKRGGWRMVLPLSLALVICCATSYLIQEAILKGITSASSAAQRRAAATLVTLTDAVHSEDVSLDGLPMDKVDFASPEGKTFLAILPALALSTDNLEQKTENELREVLRGRTMSAVGAPDKLYNEAYIVSEAEIKKSFNGYLKLAVPLEDLMRQVPAQQAKAYRRYRNELGRWTPDTLPQKYYSRVRSKLRDQGVPVSYSWDPRDKSGFYRAVERGMTGEARSRYEFEMRVNFGYVLPYDLTFDQFVADRDVQASWRDSMRLPDDRVLKANWSYDQFRAQMYDPWINEIVESEVERLLAPVSSFEDGGDNQQFGEDAIRAAYVPLIAFIFSTIGALVHLFKTVWFALMIKLHRKKVIALSALAVIAGVVMAGWAIPAATTPNAISQSLLFVKLEEDTREKAGPVLPHIMRSLIQAQTEFYPISEMIRTKVLFGIQYEFNHS